MGGKLADEHYMLDQVLEMIGDNAEPTTYGRTLKT